MKGQFINLLEVAKKLYEKEMDIKDTFDMYECDYLGYETSDIVDIALDIIGIPKDTSLEYDIGYFEYYCRDQEYSLIFDYILSDVGVPKDIYEQIKG